jgi:PAS domain S-box-containing protein
VSEGRPSRHPSGRRSAPARPATTGPVTRDVQSVLTADFQDSLATGMLLQDDQGRFVEMNAMASQLLGAERQDLLGATFADARWNTVQRDGTPFPVDERPSIKTLRTGESCTDVVLGIDNPGRSRRWLSVSTYPVREGDRVTGVLSSFNDITPLVSREHMMRVLHEVSRVVTTAESVDDALQRLCEVLVEYGHYELAWIGEVDLTADDRVAITYAAGATDYLEEGMVTWRGTQESGRGPFGNALRSGRIQVSNDLTTLAGFEPWRERARELALNSSIAIPCRPGGRDAVISIYDRHPHSFDEVAVESFQEMAREVEFLIAYFATRDRVAAVEQANEAKNFFLSRMSHELRTPLNAIIGFAQLLTASTDDETRENGSIILTAGRHLLDLVNDVLDISRIDSGKLTVSQEPVDLVEVAREAVTLITAQATGREVTVTTDRDGAAWVRADHARVRQVTLNLLTNAVKYGTPGTPIRVEVVHRDHTVRLAVVDEGPGIAPGLLGRLFQPFDRLGAEERGIEGTGLGLVLSRALIEAMGGAIGATSAAGVGSTFHIELQSTQVDDLPVREVAEAPAVEARAGIVLYIEDNPSNRQLMTRIVGLRPGVDLVSAADATSGLELAAQVRPDLIMLDLHLPDRPGLEVLARLRSEAATRDVPVVVVSADASTSTVAQLRRAGAAAYLTKPVDVSQVLNLLDALLGD